MTPSSVLFISSPAFTAQEIFDLMEVRPFQLHKNVLRDLITKQAGTIDKAVLELVMNAIEAKATIVRITLTNDQLIVVDDGLGFASREEIEAAFEVFGKSDERAAEEKKWAQFQIGRGQAFSLGKTSYRTHTFEMIVDLAACDSDVTYTLHENLPDVPGCVVAVDLYRSIEPYEFNNAIRDIERNVKYVDTAVFLNNVQINTPPLFHKWDDVTDDAYITYSEDDTSVNLYNLGVYVSTVYIQGLAGTVVSRQQLQLNSARNQVAYNCPVYRRINKHFEARASKTLLKQRSLKSSDVLRIFERIDTHTYQRSDVVKLPMFRDINGKRWSAAQLVKKEQFSFDVKGSQMGDLAMQLLRVVVLDRAFMTNALNGYDDDGDLATRLRDRLESLTHQTPPTFIDARTLSASLPHQQEMTPDDQLEQDELIALRALRATLDPSVIKKIRPDQWYDPYIYRELYLGTSFSAEAWTNGRSYIVYDRQHFARHRTTLAGWVHILSTLCHEYAHSSEEKLHDGDFYERFHNTLGGFTRYIYGVVSAYVRGLKAAGLDVPIRLGRLGTEPESHSD